MDTVELSKEQLMMLLPAGLIEDAIEGKGLENSPMFSKYKHLWTLEDDSLHYPANDSFGSPEIPPLESRYHFYTLKRQTSEKSQSVKLELSTLFQSLNFTQEVKVALNDVKEPKLQLYNALEMDKVFDKALDQIQYFVDTLGKENIPVRSILF
jgi:hypothetical protein